MMVILNVPDDGYSRNVLCALNLIFMFLLNNLYILNTNVGHKDVPSRQVSLQKMIMKNTKGRTGDDTMLCCLKKKK
jgi:hypothetical protein